MRGEMIWQRLPQPLKNRLVLLNARESKPVLGQNLKILFVGQVKRGGGFANCQLATLLKRNYHGLSGDGFGDFQVLLRNSVRHFHLDIQNLRHITPLIAQFITL